MTATTPGTFPPAVRTGIDPEHVADTAPLPEKPIRFLLGNGNSIRTDAVQSVYVSGASNVIIVGVIGTMITVAEGLDNGNAKSLVEWATERISIGTEPIIYLDVFADQMRTTQKAPK